MATNETPTSANTASHIVAKPMAPKMRKIPFTPKARPIFCHTMRRVERPIWIPRAILLGWSVWMITSAVSMATSLPKPPIAIPTSLAASTGASLMPSPINATVDSGCSLSFSTSLSLSSGSKPPLAQSIFSSLATCWVMESLSPESIMILAIPATRIC